MKRRKTRKFYCVMFGFNRDDIDDVGYLGEDLKISRDQEDAKKFWLKNYSKSKDFAEPEKWLKLINEDEGLNKGFKFHLVKKWI